MSLCHRVLAASSASTWLLSADDTEERRFHICISLVHRWIPFARFRVEGNFNRGGLRA